ncbi:MAG: hypothetical protein V1899_05535 [Planctomycetota bacterium]
MAKGQFLNSHQKGIVKRYYNNIGDISAQKLGELVSDLYLETNPVKIKQMWESAENALLKLGANKARISKVVIEKDIQALAKLAEELF